MRWWFFVDVVVVFLVFTGRRNQKIRNVLSKEDFALSIDVFSVVSDRLFRFIYR